MWLAGAMAVALAFPAAAQWKWRDSSGRTQYSDLPPPPGTPEQNILSRPAAQRRAEAARAAPAAAAAAGTSASAASAAPGLGASGASAAPGLPKGADPELEARRKKAEQDQQAKAKAEEARLAAARAENCTRARSQLQTLESGIRVARMNNKGEREFLDDKTRSDEVRRTQAIISSDCR